MRGGLIPGQISRISFHLPILIVEQRMRQL
jgi:hypothetical protein